ncbi:hypothetical protein BGW80DRAFT_527439 [Lactifluus volemus]|nr:hypothetical protein BGW80DRAFT_527439 [Lactifluus volemus]
MPRLFGTRPRRHRSHNEVYYTDTTTTSYNTTRPRRREGWTSFYPQRRNRERVAAGYRTSSTFYRPESPLPTTVKLKTGGALVNPNTTREGRRHAKWQLRRMGRPEDAHVSFLTKVKRTLGIRSTPRRVRRRREETERRDRGWFFGLRRSRPMPVV